MNIKQGEYMGLWQTDKKVNFMYYFNLYRIKSLFIHLFLLRASDCLSFILVLSLTPFGFIFPLKFLLIVNIHYIYLYILIVLFFIIIIFCIIVF